MLIVGAVFGAVLAFFFVAGPLTIAMAIALGLSPVLPIIGALTQWQFPVGTVGATISHILFSLIAYVMAAIATPVPTAGPVTVTPAGGGFPMPWEFFERFARGWLIGMNAVVTLTLPFALPWVFSGLPAVSLLLVAASPLLAIAATFIAVVIVIPAFAPGVAANSVYAGILGWTAWISPPTWPATGLGLLVCIVNSITALFGAPVRWVPEFWTGSLMTHGGILYPFWRAPAGYNLGNFYFLDPRIGATTPEFIPPAGGMAGGFIGLTADGATLHETGHTLNAAAFGSWFNYVGWAHQNFFPPGLNGGPRAYAEVLAEAHLRDSTQPWFPFWAPPVGLTALTPNAPPTFGTTTVDGLPPGAFLNYSAGASLTLSGASADADSYPAATLIPGSPATGVRWVFTTQPAGAGAAIAGATTAATTATVPRGGDYTLAFVATDGAQLPTAGALVFTPKVVEAVVSVPIVAVVDQPFTADGSMSTAGADLAGAALPLTFAWSVAPPSAVIADPTLPIISVTPSETAPHVVTLTVTAAGAAGTSHTASSAVPVS